MEEIAGIVLAGGLSRRMGGIEKAFLKLDGRPLIAHVLERLSAQASPVAINANGDPSRFAAFGRPVVADETPTFEGPLAGILAGMLWVRREAPHIRFLATAACDTPLFPKDLVAKLLAAASSEASPSLALSASGGRIHPIFGLWPVALAPDLTRALACGERKVIRWAANHAHKTVEFSASGAPFDPFFNVNTPADLAEAERFYAHGQTP